MVKKATFVGFRGTIAPPPFHAALRSTCFGELEVPKMVMPTEDH